MFPKIKRAKPANTSCDECGSRFFDEALEDERKSRAKWAKDIVKKLSKISENIPSIFTDDLLKVRLELGQQAKEDGKK